MSDLKKWTVEEGGETPEQTAEAAQEAPQEAAPQAEEISAKKNKKERTPEQKKQHRKRGCAIAGGIVGGTVGLIALVVAIFAILNTVTTKALHEQAASYEKVTYTAHEQLAPQQDADGYYFSTDRDLDVMQLTDVHIGSGFLSQQKDTWAMNAVANMIRERQPDLVIVTGDISYPVPFSSGSFNNLNPVKVFATEMESLGVYWTFAFGNHDTEAYSYYSRQQICDWYADQHFQYCLFEGNNAIEDKAEAEDFGYGNNIIRVKDKNTDLYTQALVLFDSHSYTDGDYLGMLWKYDNIHQSQIDWYAEEMGKLRAYNASKGLDAPVKNLAFFHIPMREYREAWSELVEHNGKMGVKGDVMENSEHVQYVYGVNEEITGASVNPLAGGGEDTYGVFCGVKNEELDGKFWAAAKANGMQGAFCGHDHINNFSVIYEKDGFSMRLTYGMSVDYLAYAGIFQRHSQRGCTAITVKTNGDFECQQLNYYTDFGIPAEAGDLSDAE